MLTQRKTIERLRTLIRNLKAEMLVLREECRKKDARINYLCTECEKLKGTKENEM